MCYTIRTIVITLVTVVVLLSVVLGLIIYVDNRQAEYYKGSQWNCKSDEYRTVYLQLYEQKIDELKELYGLSFEKSLEVTEYDDGDTKFEFYLCCEEYTIILYLSNCGIFGLSENKVYYYGDGSGTYTFEEMKNLFAFLNDFTNFVAFDTMQEDNPFETLFMEALSKEKGKQYSSNYFHFDNMIGNVGYYMDLIPKDRSYYYMMSKDTEVERKACTFGFNGLLKPIN